MNWVTLVLSSSQAVSSKHESDKLLQRELLVADALALIVQRAHLDGNRGLIGMIRAGHAFDQSTAMTELSGSIQNQY